MGPVKIGAERHVQHQRNQKAEPEPAPLLARIEQGSAKFTKFVIGRFHLISGRGGSPNRPNISQVDSTGDWGQSPLPARLDNAPPPRVRSIKPSSLCESHLLRERHMLCHPERMPVRLGPKDLTARSNG